MCFIWALSRFVHFTSNESQNACKTSDFAVKRARQCLKGGNRGASRANVLCGYYPNLKRIIDAHTIFEYEDRQFLFGILMAA